MRALKAAVAAHSQIDEAAIRAETSEFAAVWGSPANKAAVARAYPLAHPRYKCAVHEVRVTTGVATFEGVL